MSKRIIKCRKTDFFSSKLGRFIICVAIIYFIGILCNQQITIAQLNNKKENLKIQITQQQNLNKNIKNQMTNKSKLERVEKIAREKFSIKNKSPPHRSAGGEFGVGLTESDPENPVRPDTGRRR